MVYELPATSQWIFECHWCPRNPSIISTASFDGHVTMYSLLGGGGTENKGADPTQAQVAPPPSSGDFFNDLSSSVASRNRVVETAPLKTPPKWFRRPCGASFAVSVCVCVCVCVHACVLGACVRVCVCVCLCVSVCVRERNVK